jgi:two-component system sensor histidine kinase UhpB
LEKDMGDTARHSTLHRLAEFEKPSRLVRKSVSDSLLALLARCFFLSLLYYVLVVVSMRLRFSTSGLSLLWPSNALLVAILVLTPKRRWWVYLLSVIPAHIAALSPYHLGFSWLAYQIAFNSVEAIACAVILQRFRSSILYFETLEEVLIFLGVSVVVPGLANLVAIYPVVEVSSRAALLAHNSTDGFLAVWTSCWANNSASLIVFVPVILVCVTRGRDGIRSLSWRGVGEGTLLTVLLTTLTFLVYGNVHTVVDALPIVYLIPIPFLIWAAVRFGPVGACLSITLFVCVSSWCAYLGQGPFLRSVSIDRVTVLQMTWIIISAPLLCLAAVVRERKVAVEELKRAHSELQEFTPRLIAAQEQEKQRISRELHDDMGQRLALLRVGLDLVDQRIPVERSAEHAEICDLLAQLDELAIDVRNMSHQLHSSKLRYLGLPAALKEVCQQLVDQHRVAIQLTTYQLPEPLSEQVSLCFYRVAQEALMNAVKHSGTSRVDVSLDCKGQLLRMCIQDYGSGFDSSVRGKGLGLVAMHERLRMVGGMLRLNSVAGIGTKVEAEVNVGDASLNAA